MEKYGFVYLWYNRRKKKFYVGCHWGREDDGYVCSSKLMRQAYARNPSYFKRRILARVNTSRAELLAEEFKWLQKIKTEELGKRYYNVNNKQCGHWSADPQKRMNMVDRNSGSKNPMAGRKHSEETKRKMSEAKKGKKPNNYGKPVSAETREKMSTRWKGANNPRSKLRNVP